MIRILARRSMRFQKSCLSSATKSVNKPKKTILESFVFPREQEGNIYKDNWSLTEDGVTPVGGAFRNPRTSLVIKKLGIPQPKDSNNIHISSPPINTGSSSSYNLLEAGDSKLSHSDFKDFRDVQFAHLQLETVELFVEDACLGGLRNIRVGVRVTSDNPAHALIARNLLIPTPPREVDHRARFNGWNLDERWAEKESTWSDENQQFRVESISANGIPRKGDRPIVAFVGSIGDTVAIQFVESNSKVVGANILIGEKAPARGLIEAVGTAADVLINQDDEEGFSIPSTVISMNNNQHTYVVIGGNDELIQKAAKKNILYGAYNNYISSYGVAALWNGYLTTLTHLPPPSSTTTPSSLIPMVINKDDYVIANPPDNLIAPVKEFIFIDKNVTKSTKLSEEDAVKRLTDLTGPTKSAIIQSIVKGVKCTVVNSSTEASALFV